MSLCSFACSCTGGDLCDGTAGDVYCPIFWFRREEVDGLFPIRDLRPLDPPNAADAEAEELSAVGAALAMVSFLSRLHYQTRTCLSTHDFIALFVGADVAAFFAYS